MLTEPNPVACPKCGAHNLTQLLTTFRIAGLKKKSASVESDAGPGSEAGFGSGFEDGMDDEMMGGGYPDDGGSAEFDSEDAGGGESFPPGEET